MKYKKIIPARFISRPNRFTAFAEIDGRQEQCHVMNTGRMRELLVPGAEIFLCPAENTKRKTKYDVVAVRRGNEIVNIDSLAPNRVAAEYIPTLFPGCKLIRPETKFGSSRFDFYIEDSFDKIFLEVKGVTLNCAGEARFPDAPTLRGTKHLHELAKAKTAGFRAAVLFVIAMKGINSFAPNKETDEAFAAALFAAADAGVEIYAVDCTVTPDSMTADCKIPVRME